VAQHFSALLRRILKKQYRTSKAFATAIGVKPSHLSRAMAPDGQPFNIEGCLKLAQVTNTPPSTVLRAAGKARIATLIEQLYGPARELSASEQQLLRDYAATTNSAILSSVRTLLEYGAKAAKGSRKRSSGGGRGGGGTAGGSGGGPDPSLPDLPQKEPERVHRPAIYQHRARAR
jgi:hypothetical protein